MDTVSTMTRAQMMFEALADGPKTRHEIWSHAGCFFLTNNAAAELRRDGHTVEYVREDDSYRLLDERHESRGSAVSETADPSPLVALVEHDGGQYALDIGAAA